MQRKIFLVGWSLLLFLSLSCTRVTDLSPEGCGEVVVICVLTEEATQSLTLDLTDIASPEARTTLAEAEIVLFDESDGILAGQFINKSGKEWELDYAAIPEHSYHMTITIPGREEINATTTMPPVSHIAYYFNSWYYGTSYDLSSLPEGPLWVMGMNHDHDRTGHHIAAEKMATSLTTVDPFNVTGDVFHAFDFFTELVKYAEPEKGNDFFYPNVEGQPLYDKMFRIPSVQERTRMAEGPIIIHIEDSFIEYNTKLFSVAGYFRTAYHPLQNGEEGKLVETDGYVLFISPSEEYDKYLREVISMRMQQEAVGDYASLFSRKNVYTNIENGLGLFGARTEQKLPWNDKPLLTY